MSIRHKRADVFSPLTGKKNIKLLKEIKTEVIIDAYKRNYNINVSNYFININQMKVYFLIINTRGDRYGN